MPSARLAQHPVPSASLLGLALARAPTNAQPRRAPPVGGGGDVVSPDGAFTGGTWAFRSEPRQRGAPLRRAGAAGCRSSPMETASTRATTAERVLDMR